MSLKRLCNNVDGKRIGKKEGHQIWYSPKKYRISVQNKNGKAKGYQVQQFLTQYMEETNNG